MDKDLFDDLIASCQEVIAHQKGLIQLKTTTVEIPDSEIGRSRLFEAGFPAGDFSGREDFVGAKI
ncbi:MAG: hypothetical protein LBE35_09025 [Clostridiales bacterium]|jgi:hypothetical protein|nr:hypothetical protein [Clostridiales bacterium]